jgi:shikimate dehydrogenase
MPDILFPAHLDNQITRDTERYAAILGLSPSKGARSPTLWNAAYAAAGADAVMHPFDVNEANLAGLVAALKADPRYVGGSVAVPHKQGLISLLDRLEPEAERIGAVNAIYRDGTDLVGANTDGAGALAQLRALVDNLGARHALVLGLGGAGLAVAAYLAENVASLKLANRSVEKAEAFAERLGGKVRGGPLPRSSADLRGINLIVNCTSVGYQDGDQGSSLGDNSEALLDAMPDDTVIYDIIYQPGETELLRQAKVIGLVTLNGLGMNQDQAVIAFDKANPGLLSIDAIRDAMQSAG